MAEADQISAVHLSQLMNLELSFRDEEGRPLAENKVPPEYRADAPMELAECNYYGSRYKHLKPMNISALKQMTAHWPAIISGFNTFRDFSRQEKGGRDE